MSLPRPLQHSRINFLYGLTLFLSYFLVAKLGLLLATINHHVSPIWPASGVAASGLIFLGRQYWPFVWAGAFAVNSFLGTPLLTVLMMSVGNTLEAIVSEYCFRRFAKDRSKDEIPMIAGLAASLFFAVPIAAVIGSLSLATSSWGRDPTFVLISNIITWWTGDSIGLLLVVPIVLRARMRDYTSTNWKKSLEAVVYCLATLALGYLTIWITPDITATIMFLFPLLLIGIWRLGAVETGISIWLLVVLCVLATLRARGPFNEGDFNTNLIQLQLFIGALIGSEIALRFLKHSRAPKSAIVTLFVGWLVTGLVFNSFNHKESEIDQARFNKLVSDANSKMAERLLLHETVLRSAAGYLRSVREFEDDKWRTFVSELDIQKFTGLYGIGHIVSVPSNELDAWLVAHKKKVGPEMKYSEFNPPGMKRTQGPVTEHVIVIGFEPRRKGGNNPIVLDMTYDAVRFKALIEARESGSIRISDKVPIQNMSDTTGYLLVTPVFRTTNFATPAEKKAAFIGWVHSPVLMSRLLEGVFGANEPEVAMIAEFVGADQKEETVYPVSIKREDLNPSHIILTELPIWGKTLRMSWHRTDNFESRKDTTAAWIHFIGVLITLLAAAAVMMYEGQFRQAQRIADQRTREVQLRDRLWTSLTRVVPAGIFQLDVNGKLTFTNEKWNEYTKIDLSINPDVCWITAFDPNDHQPVRQLWDDLRQKRVDSMQVQCRVPASSKTFAMSLRSVQDTRRRNLAFYRNSSRHYRDSRSTNADHAFLTPGIDWCDGSRHGPRD